MKKSRHTKENITSAISQFFAVRGLIRTRLARGKKTDASTWLRFEVLKFIADHGASCIKDVAEYLSVTAPSATSLVCGLVRDGLVEKHIDAHDRRIVHLDLTARGRRRLADAVERGTVLVSELFAPLSLRELALFTRTLERILRAGRK